MMCPFFFFNRTFATIDTNEITKINFFAEAAQKGLGSLFFIFKLGNIVW